MRFILAWSIIRRETQMYNRVPVHRQPICLIAAPKSRSLSIPPGYK